MINKAIKTLDNLKQELLKYKQEKEEMKKNELNMDLKDWTILSLDEHTKWSNELVRNPNYEFRFSNAISKDKPKIGRLSGFAVTYDTDYHYFVCIDENLKIETFDICEARRKKND